jgi:DNA-binding SARP family transcriptional activator
LSALVLQLFGGFRLVDRNGGEIRIASRKARALLAYLALRKGESQARDRLATLLWDDTDEELARTSLRQALTALRKALPESANAMLRADTESLGLDGSLLDTDVDALRRALTADTRTALQEAIAHYRGDLLEGFDAKSAAFDEWANTERRALRRQVVATLTRLTELCSANGDAEGAVTACSRLVALEPLNEAAHRDLMDLYARRGAYADALRQYRVCRDALRRELDVSPEAATESLYREIMRRRRAGAVASDSNDALDPGDIPPRASETPAPVSSVPTLRDATILVVRLEGLLELEASLDPEDLHALASDFQTRVHGAVREFGGRADRRVGATVMAVFGVPMAYGNEAERAARTALALRDSITAELTTSRPELRLRVGIAQGQVLCSSELFPLTGRPAHAAHSLAARAADGEILAADNVRNSLAERATLSRASSHAGNAPDPAPAWTLLALRTESPVAAAPLVGRRPELAMILATLDRCTASRRGRAIVVRGDAGIGKTRLIDAVRVAARERGVATHAARVFDFGQSPGQRPVTALALSLLGASAEAPATERAAAVRRRLVASGGSIDQIIFLSDLIDAPLDAELTALEEAMEAAIRQRGRALALSQLIESAAQRAPQLFVIEDVHWADVDELARFGEIAAVVANCPILFVMTTRAESDPVNATSRARARGCPITTVDLAPLATDEAQELAAHYAELPREVIDACIARAEGNPLFLDQLLRNAAAGDASLPGSVRTLVLARADRLSPDDHRALEACAVLGFRFSLAALREMIGVADFEPSALVDAALLRSDGVEIEFAHALFRDAIYESTLRSKRRELHDRAATWFAHKDSALHAEHLAAAEDERAAAAYVAAARDQQAALRFERALGLATKANAIAREPLMLHAISCLLGALLLELGRSHDALTAYREALDFALDSEGHGHAWYGIAAALRIMDRHEEALDALERAEAALGDAADPQTRARMATLRGNLCFPLGRLDACLAAHEQAHRYAVAANSPFDIARALGGLGDAYYQRGRMMTARDHFAQCVQEARAHSLAGVLLGNLPMLGLTEMYCGNAPAARESCRESLELARRIGDLRGELLVHLITASGLLMQAQTDECRARAQRGLDLARQLGARRFQAECVGMLASAALLTGERASAESLIEEGLALGRETSMSYCGPMLLSVFARITTNPLLRTRALADGEALLAEGCVSHSYFDFYCNAIEVSLEEQRVEDVRRYAQALENYTEAEPLPLTQLMIARARALADVVVGADARATRNALESVREDCRRTNALMLLPAVEAALIAAQSVREGVQ